MSTKKSELIGELIELLREQSTQTVIFHSFIAEQLGLNVTDHKALDLIVKGQEMTAGKLAAMTGLTTGAITGVIDRLEKAGFVRRVLDPADRRRVIIQFVPESSQKLYTVFSPVQTQTVAMLEKYSEKEIVLIKDFLREAIKMVVDIRTAPKNP